MTLLPTGWLRTGGAFIARTPRGVDITLPRWLLPERHYCLVRASHHPDGVMLDITHDGLFTKATPGRNAWQTEVERFLAAAHNTRQRTRDLTQNWERLLGDRQAIQNLRDRLFSAPMGQPFTLNVRVTPEGFQVLIRRLAPGQCPTITSHVPLADERKAICDALHNARNHGGPQPKVSVLEDLCWKLITHDGNYNYNYNQENEDMSIDKTTAGDLPFGLIAGEKIVSCEFDDGGRDYAYFAGSLELAVGDYVVVASPYGNGVLDKDSGGYLKVVRVTSIDANVEGIKKAAKWIISKVDLSAYQARRRQVEELRIIDEQIRLAEREARKELELVKLMELSPQLKELVTRRLALAGTSAEAPAA